MQAAAFLQGPHQWEAREAEPWLWAELGRSKAAIIKGMSLDWLLQHGVAGGVEGAGLGPDICLQGTESLPSSILPCLEILIYTLKCIQESSNNFFLYFTALCPASFLKSLPTAFHFCAGQGQVQAPQKEKNGAMWCSERLLCFDSACGHYQLYKLGLVRKLLEHHFPGL